MPTTAPPLPRQLLVLVILLILTSTATSQQVLLTVSGSVDDGFGRVGDVLGDLDGDGYAELLVGAPEHDPGAAPQSGAVHVLAGADGAPLDILVGIAAFDRLGAAVCGPGDVDGDGVPDLCVTANGVTAAGGPVDAGQASVLSGATGSILWTTSGHAPNDRFGWSAAALGDVDLDGFPDLAVGAILGETASSPGNAGSVSVLSGADGHMLLELAGQQPLSGFGTDVGRAGDVDADGYADLIVVDGERAKVYAGIDGAQLHVLQNAGGGAAGIKVSGGVDVDGDGHDELIVGAGLANDGAGRVRVFSGDTGEILHEWSGGPDDRLGRSVLGLGDLDADGFGDVAAGAPRDDDGGANSGGIWAWSGRTGQLIAVVSGAPGWRIGTDLGSGDVDADGVPDVLGTSVSQARALVASFVPIGLTPFGTGTPGCDGPLPLLANHAPTIGDASFRLQASGLPPGQTALLVIGNGADVAGTLIAGVLAHVALPPAGTLVHVFETPAADSLGTLIVPLPLPANAALIGLDLVAQLAAHWPGPGCGTATTSSRGLHITIQP